MAAVSEMALSDYEEIISMNYGSVTAVLGMKFKMVELSCSYSRKNLFFFFLG